MNELLDRVNKFGADRGRDKYPQLQRFFGRCSPRELKWLLRVMQRDHGIGARPSQPVPARGEWPKCV